VGSGVSGTQDLGWERQMGEALSRAGLLTPCVQAHSNITHSFEEHVQGLLRPRPGRHSYDSAYKGPAFLEEHITSLKSSLPHAWSRCVEPLV
jgi:hypothetical protein